ncbi:hypothetical protein GCM10008941_25120 [Rhizomicrobium palustre]
MDVCADGVRLCLVDKLWADDHAMGADRIQYDLPVSLRLHPRSEAVASRGTSVCKAATTDKFDR